MAVSFASFKPDAGQNPVVALRVSVAESDQETPIHEHPNGQLFLALHGAVTSQVPGSMWIVPPDCAVWIPGGVPHSCRTTPNARICFLFVKPGVARLPEHPCTLEITPMVREMILHLTDRVQDERRADKHTLRLMRVLLGELETMPETSFRLPVSVHPKLKPIIDSLTADPSERSTLAQWADRIAMSERTLARLVVKETGMTFGRWRQQLHILVALRQLADGQSVQHVSDSLGYASVTAFITMFKNALGVTPSRYFAKRVERQLGR